MIVGEGEILIKPLYLVLMKNHLGNCKQCKTLIKHGHVYVNGEKVTSCDLKVSQDDKIVVDEKEIESQPFVYYMMNKPKGYLCANSDKEKKCVVDLLERDDCCCVGRLDQDTTGLLLLTNDKSLVKRLLLPQRHVQKVYEVETLKPLSDDLVKRFDKGIVIDCDVECMSSHLEIIDDYHCYVTLYEGKYHQIKKMFLSCDNQVVSLHRVRFHHLKLDESLKQGEYRLLDEEECNLLEL